MSRASEATVLLRRIASGDGAAREELASLVYGELRRIAERQRTDRPGDTLQPTALVHEAWLRLESGESRDYTSRNHFFAVASRAMRSVLVDHVRAKRTRKREAAVTPTVLDEAVAHLEAGETDLLDLEDALAALEREDPELGRVVEMRFFGGLSHEEIAAVRGCSVSTVERHWRLARAWLRKRLGERAT